MDRLGGLPGDRFRRFPQLAGGTGDSGFRRPFIDLPIEYLNPAAFRTPRGLGRDRTPSELRAVWNLLVAQVRDAGLVLGTFAELPERR